MSRQGRDPPSSIPGPGTSNREGAGHSRVPAESDRGAGGVDDDPGLLGQERERRARRQEARSRRKGCKGLGRTAGGGRPEAAGCPGEAPGARRGQGGHGDGEQAGKRAQAHCGPGGARRALRRGALAPGRRGPRKSRFRSFPYEIAMCAHTGCPWHARPPAATCAFWVTDEPPFATVPSAQGGTSLRPLHAGSTSHSSANISGLQLEWPTGCLRPRDCHGSLSRGDTAHLSLDPVVGRRTQSCRGRASRQAGKKGNEQSVTCPTGCKGETHLRRKTECH